MVKNLATCLLAATSLVNAATVTFTNKHRYYFDTDGNAIDSVNGKVDWVKDQYIWIAEPSSTRNKISYSSPDLKSWKNNGPLFDITTPINAAACSGFGACSRPKIVYNQSTKKYVFYGFAGTPNGKGVPVFTSNNLTSGYVFQGLMKPDYDPAGYIVEDLGLSVIDGKGYLSYTSFNLTRTITQPSSIWPPFVNIVRIQQLTDDFLNGTGKAYPVIQQGSPLPEPGSATNLIDGQVQSPDLIKRNGLFYMVGSATCAFCNGTNTLAYRSPSYQGPWTRQIVDIPDTCGGQAMGVMTVPASGGPDSKPSFVFHADEFQTAPRGLPFVEAKGHSFWTLDFNSDGSIKPISCDANAQFTVDAPPAKVPISTAGRAVNPTDGSGNSGDYSSEAEIPRSSFYQTWTNSKDGSLREIGINLASQQAPGTNLTITVFRYKNESQLLSPFFNWETLAVDVVPSASLPGYFGVHKTNVTATVKKGDRLGFSLMNAALTPPPYEFGYLVRNASCQDHKLYALNRGAISYRELQGNQPPIFNLPNKELKWYSIVD